MNRWHGRRLSTFRHILNFAASSFIPAAAVSLGVAIFTRLVQPADYGRYVLAQTSALFISVVASQWLQQATTRYIPGIRNTEKIGPARSVVAVCLVGIGLAVAAVTTLLSLVHVQDTRWSGLLLPASAFAVVNSIYAPLITLLQSEVKSARYASSRIINSVATILVPAVLIALVGSRASVLMWGAFLAVAVTSLLTWRWAELPAPADRLLWRSFALPTLRKFLKYGVPLTGWFLFSSSLPLVDRYIIQLHRGEVEVGIYSASYTLMNGLATLIAGPLVMMAHPILMRAWDKGDREVVSRWLGSIVELLFVMNLFLTSLVSIFVGELSGVLLGSSFRDGQRLAMPLIFLAGAIWQIAMYAHKPLEFTGRTRLMVVLLGSVVLFSAVGNWYLVPVLGYLAACIVWLSSSVLYFLLATAVGKQVVTWQVRFPPVLLGAICSVAPYGLAAVLREPLNVALGRVLGTVVLAALVLVAAGLGFVLIEARNLRRLWDDEKLHFYMS